jgi:hypothetical protein
MEMLDDLLSRGRDAEAHQAPTTDDRSNLDYLQAAMRIRWRTLIWGSLNSSILGD